MEGGFRDWLAGLGRREMAVLAVAGLLVVGAAALWYVRSLPRPVAVSTRPSRPVPGPTASPAAVFVHVAGAVRHPGVYELPEGRRVIDAIELAGGPSKGANLDALNLAAPLVDGQQILVPKGSGDQGAGSATGSGPGLINVNTADEAALETLPGIGPVLAGAIVEYREEHGPFGSVDQLEDVSGIGPSRLAQVRDLVTV